MTRKETGGDQRELPRFQVGQSVFVGSAGGELPRGMSVVIEMASRRQRNAGWRYWVEPSRHTGPGGRLWMDEEMLSAERPSRSSPRE